MKLVITTLVLLFIGVLDGYSQEKKQAPIPIEVVFGNNKYGIQTILNRQLPKVKNTSFFSVTYVDNDYENNVVNLEVSNVSQLIYDVYKGIGVSLGVNTNKISGFSPTIGARYTYATPKLVFVMSPDFIFSNDKNIALFSLLQYQPKLTEKINLYSRLQGLYNHNLNIEKHERSYAQLRLGLGVQKYSFGFAANLDYFGPDKIFMDNYGIFMKVDL